MVGEPRQLMGPSGCGKSTLLHLLGGLQRPTGGRLWLAGRRVDTMSERALARLRRDHVGFVFQSFHLMEELTAVENVETPAVLTGLAQEPDLDKPGFSDLRDDRLAQAMLLSLAWPACCRC